jgi:hypothetical protein
MSTYRGANVEARLPCPNILRCQEIPDCHLGRLPQHQGWTARGSSKAAKVDRFYYDREEER